MHRVFIITISLFCFLSIVNAQNTIQPRQFSNPSAGIVYDKEFSMDLRLHTNGWAIAANFGEIKTFYKTRYWHFELGELKHPKQFRHSFDYPSQWGNRTSKSFFFGKQNNLYALRAGVGIKRYYSEKAKRKGVAVGVTYEGGPTLGLQKPYYLDFLTPQNGGEDITIVSQKYTGDNIDEFLNVERIYGASGFRKGLSEIIPVPGVHGKIAVHFDWGAFDEFVKAFEAGIMVDVFLKEIPILVDDTLFPENRPYFVNLYLTLQLGKRR